MPAISQSKEYTSFRRNVSQQRKIVDANERDKFWRYYDCGPKSVRSPIVFLPSAGGTAEVFFKQLLGLGSAGYRLIAVDYPAYWTHVEWCDSFARFLDQLGVEKVHLFGTALGGFLAQVFAQTRPKRVESMVLCNTFCDSSTFRENAPYFGMFSWIPEFALKREILANFPTGSLEPAIADSVDFMVEQIEMLSQPQLASRLTLNSSPFSLPSVFPPEHVTIVDTMDEVAISTTLRDQVRAFYPGAKQALLKTGGNFPYLSRPDEVNMHIRVHCRPFENTRYSAVNPPEGTNVMSRSSSNNAIIPTAPVSSASSASAQEQADAAA